MADPDADPLRDLLHRALARANARLPLKRSSDAGVSRLEPRQSGPPKFDLAVSFHGLGDELQMRVRISHGIAITPAFFYEVSQDPNFRDFIASQAVHHRRAMYNALTHFHPGVTNEFNGVFAPEPRGEVGWIGVELDVSLPDALRPFP